jgi:hypothetical protein
MQQLQNQFNTDFTGNLGTTLSDPAMVDRFNQLNLQSQGFDAFLSPNVQQQLRLTAGQRDQLRQLVSQWHQQVNDLRTGAGTDPDQVQQQLTDLQAQMWQQANGILNPQQQQAWAQLIGQRFNFPPMPQANAGAQGTVGLRSTTGQRTQVPGAAQPTVPQSATQPQQGTVR